MLMPGPGLQRAFGKGQIHARVFPGDHPSDAARAGYSLIRRGGVIKDTDSGSAFHMFSRIVL